MTDFNACPSRAGQVIRPISSGNCHLWLHYEIAKDQITLKKNLFDLKENEIFGIYGPSNSGKSSLLCFLDMTLSRQSLPGVMDQQSNLILEGQEANKALTSAHEDPIATNLSALEALIRVLQPFDLSETATRTRLKHALRYLCHEGEVYTQPLSEAPKAMATKVAILQVLFNPPAYLLLDEPTKGLTARSKAEVHELLRTLQEKGGTSIILATSDPGEAEEICDRVALVDEGRILAIGTTPALTSMLDPGSISGSTFSHLHGQLLGETPTLVG